jgi:hypothetical protein
MAYKQQKEKDDEEAQVPVKRYDVFNNKNDRQFIRDFAKQFGSIGSQAYCERMGWFRITPRYPEGAYLHDYIIQINEAMEIFKTIKDLEDYDKFTETATNERLAESEKKQ